MAEITRPSGCSDWLDLAFVQRELMSLYSRLHIASISLSDTVSELEKFGVTRSRKVAHDWVQKAGL